MSLLNGPGVSNAAAFIVLATDGLSEADRDVFLREVISYAAAGLQELHGPRAAAEAVYGIADYLCCREGS